MRQVQSGGTSFWQCSTWRLTVCISLATFLEYGTGGSPSKAEQASWRVGLLSTWSQPSRLFVESHSHRRADPWRCRRIRVPSSVTGAFVVSVRGIRGRLRGHCPHNRRIRFTSENQFSEGTRVRSSARVSLCDMTPDRTRGNRPRPHRLPLGRVRRERGGGSTAAAAASGNVVAVYAHQAHSTVSVRY